MSILKAVADRIENGELIVYLKEEYGYKQWFWFPDINSDKLEAYWDGLSVSVGVKDLCGDVILVVDKYTESQDRAQDDPRSQLLESEEFYTATDDDCEVMIAKFDSWMAEYYPVQALWLKGNGNGDWIAHIHTAGDSWLKNQTN